MMLVTMIKKSVRNKYSTSNRLLDE